MKETFTERGVQNNLKSNSNLQLPNVKTAKYGIEHRSPNMGLITGGNLVL